MEYERDKDGFMHNVIVFGSMNMDLTIESDRMPQAGETLTGRGFFTNPGGKGANQAAAAARMGAPTYMVGAVGDDGFGVQMRSALEDAGADCSRLRTVEGVSTGVASITRIDGDNRIILDPGANHVPTIDDVRAALDGFADEGDIFLTQLECDIPTTLDALRSARERGMYTVLNPAPAVELPDTTWSCVDMVCLNETECELLSGIMPETDERVREAAKFFQAKGVSVVAITLGSRGSITFEGDAVWRLVPPEHETVDTTCAGDTYIGACVASLAAGSDVPTALRWGTCASALATTKLGAQQSIPSVEEVSSLVGTLSA